MVTGHQTPPSTHSSRRLCGSGVLRAVLVRRSLVKGKQLTPFFEMPSKFKRPMGKREINCYWKTARHVFKQHDKDRPFVGSWRANPFYLNIVPYRPISPSIVLYASLVVMLYYLAHSSSSRLPGSPDEFSSHKLIRLPSSCSAVLVLACHHHSPSFT
eukprot:760304-Hanusia_phi.AAC.1